MPRDGTATRERILDGAQRLMLDKGFSATTVDAVIADAGVAKGAFFHHFPSKGHLARALVERYAAADLEHLEQFMCVAEAASDDPYEQLVGFLRAMEEVADALVSEQTGCLYTTFVYEHQLVDDATIAVIRDTLQAWRERVAAKLDAIVVTRPPRVPVDLDSLADSVMTAFEGAFVVARATGDPTVLRRQLGHLRTYLELLFEPRRGRPR